MKLLKLILSISFCFLFVAANAQYDFKKIDTWLKDNTPEMGGRSFLIIYKDGHVIYSNGVNEMSFKQKAMGKMIARKQGKTVDFSDYTANTKQQIASCSKWLSAALIMTFVDEGKLKVTDTVGKWLPVLSAHGKGKITISQCLSHLTGIKAPPLKENLQEMKNASTMDEAIANLAGLPMEGEPGKVFHYSNVGLQIAGAVIEKISGKSFETLFAERIATPLNMKNTDFGKGKVALPAGGASSTPQDYMNFLVMILNEGTFNGKRILTKSSITQMQINRLTPDVNNVYTPAEAGHPGYGYGEWVGTACVSSPGLFGSYPVVDTKHKYAAFLMTFYFKSDGRQERYAALKKLIDEAVK